LGPQFDDTAIELDADYLAAGYGVVGAAGREAIAERAEA
jgi:hypothetical protein